MNRSRLCTVADITIRPDHYYRITTDGEPVGEMVNHGGEHLYYCNNCGDISYSMDEVLSHFERRKAEIQKQQQEADELYELGVTRYLDKTDFNIGEWLEPEELANYNNLTGDQAHDEA